VAFAIAPEAARRLVAYHWPGNIRELENLCARWVVTADGAEIGLRDLPAHVRGGGAPAGHEAGSSQSLRCKEDSIIRQTLIETGGRVAEAARRLAINKTTIYRRMKRWPSEQVAACNPGG
jgi:DNA-binding NtrC family response regulator